MTSISIFIFFDFAFFLQIFSELDCTFRGGSHTIVPFCYCSFHRCLPNVPRLSFLIFLVLTKSDVAVHSYVKLSMSLTVTVWVANQLTLQPPWAYWEVPGYIVVRIRKEES